MTVSGLLTLDVERPVAGGRSLARHDGQVVLVAGAIPGERVRGQVTRVDKRVLFADVVEVVESSPFRRLPVSDPACGGLAFAHVDYAHQAVLKADIVADAFRRVGKMSLPGVVPFTSSPEQGYRWRARLHVRNRLVGFFREGSHDVCDAGPSAQLRPEALTAALALVKRLNEAVRHVDAVTVVENADASARLACLDVLDAGEDAVADALGDRVSGGFTGLAVTDRRGARSLAGDESVVDSFASLGLVSDATDTAVQWRRRPSSFFQGNRYMVGPLLEAVLADVRGTRVLDLYAGVGLFSVPLAARGMDVLAVEGDASSGADLRDNAAPFSARLTAHVASVEFVLDRCRSGVAGTAIVDPPRTGLSTRALQRLLTLNVPRLIYVSCDPATLARDVSAAVTAGYDVVSVRGFDMFPNTPHIETVTVLDKRG